MKFPPCPWCEAEGNEEPNVAVEWQHLWEAGYCKVIVTCSRHRLQVLHETPVLPIRIPTQWKDEISIALFWINLVSAAWLGLLSLATGQWLWVGGINAVFAAVSWRMGRWKFDHSFRKDAQE